MATDGSIPSQNEATGLGAGPQYIWLTILLVHWYFGYLYKLTKCRFDLDHITRTRVAPHAVRPDRTPASEALTRLGTESWQTCMGLFLSSGCFGLVPVLCSERKAVLRSVACDQVLGARGRGQGTETLAQLGQVRHTSVCYYSQAGKTIGTLPFCDKGNRAD